MNRRGFFGVLAGVLAAVCSPLKFRRQLIEQAVVVAIDPSGGVAETGIVVVGVGADDICYVLADSEVALYHASPQSPPIELFDEQGYGQAERRARQGEGAA